MNFEQDGKHDWLRHQPIQICGALFHGRKNRNGDQKHGCKMFNSHSLLFPSSKRNFFLKKTLAVGHTLVTASNISSEAACCHLLVLLSSLLVPTLSIPAVRRCWCVSFKINRLQKELDQFPPWKNCLQNRLIELVPGVEKEKANLQHFDSHSWDPRFILILHRPASHAYLSPVTASWKRISFTLAAPIKYKYSRTSRRVWGDEEKVISLCVLQRSRSSDIWRLCRVSVGLTLDYG
ncbi:hypothetical protein PIB30_090271 [Stylosanthes scabra]|uniref:Uncharacterized protein n=1 Tax=Stylosanthes scabra TaxID=79078 RepID=A0ABU6UWK0_9FABA|nr:hypothetical protein [Stylosanthes scabra]